MRKNGIGKKRTRPTSQRKPGPNPASGKEVAYQNKDIISKVFAESFKGKALRVYGLDLPEIRAVLPTNIPAVRANELRLDNLFELADSTVALVDYESKYRKKDMVKYLNYLTGIANRYLKAKKECPTLRMIVIYTGDIKRKQVSAQYNIGAVKVTLEPAFLSELDSGSIFRNIKEKVEKKELLAETELMEFIILPLSYRNRDEKEETIRTTVKLAAQIADRSQQLFVLSGILTFTDKLIDMDTANLIRRTIMMTKVGRLIEEEKRQAVAKAEDERRQALKEKQQALKDKQVALKDKQAALRQAQKEKKRADRAEAMMRQAAMESVLNMLRKNYPTEEIASIVSGFSQDDIEAIRKEMATVL